MIEAKKPGAPGAPPATRPKLRLPGMKPPPPSRRALVKAVLAQLAARFPACFAGPGVAPRPLKLGIHADLRAAMPELSVHERKVALHHYVNTPDYLRALVEAVERVGLDGTPCGRVTADEAAHAAIARAAAAPK
jgi:ProP effector